MVELVRVVLGLVVVESGPNKIIVHDVKIEKEGRRNRVVFVSL